MKKNMLPKIPKEIILNGMTYGEEAIKNLKENIENTLKTEKIFYGINGWVMRKNVNTLDDIKNTIEYKLAKYYVDNLIEEYIIGVDIVDIPTYDKYLIAISAEKKNNSIDR